MTARTRRLAVRRARVQDLPVVVAMARDFNREQRDPTRHFTLARAEKAFREGTIRMIVATVDGEVAGYSFLAPTYESSYAARGLYLNDLYVRPQYRRCGVGRALVGAAAREARRRGGSYLWWVSKPWNKAGQAFYRAIGAQAHPAVAHVLVFGAFRRLARNASVTKASASLPSSRWRRRPRARR